MITVQLTRKQLELAAEAMRAHYAQLTNDHPHAHLTSDTHAKKLALLELKGKFEAAQ